MAWLRTWSTRFQSGSGWYGMETDSKENVLEWTVDDFDKKVIDEVVEAKRFKNVMFQSGKESPGEQCGGQGH